METRFPTTIWTSLRVARGGDRNALDTFIQRYRSPVLRFIHRRGYSPDDSEDLTQEVFLLLLRDNLLARAEEGRGRFRSFLLGVTKNVLRNASRVQRASKRGGGQPLLALDAATEEGSTFADLLQQPENDGEFDREWMRNLVGLSLERMRTRHERYYQVMKGLVEEGLSYAQIAERSGLEPQQIGNLLHQARRKLVELVREEIAAYCSSGREFEDESKVLSPYLEID